MNRKYFIGIFWMLLLLLAGCTKENTEDCFSGLKLDFYFTLHTGNGNLFGEKVHRVCVYLFDENDILQLYAVDNGNKLEYSYLQKGQIKTVSTPNDRGGLTNDYVMNLEQVPAGKYKIMAWAESGLGDNTTFFYGQMKNPATHDFEKNITLGVTTMENFQTLLRCKATAGLSESLTPEANEIDDLWYGTAGVRHPKTDVYSFEKVEVQNGVITERHIELIRNTNILNVTVSGIEHLVTEDTNFRVWVVTSDGSYQSDNNICEYAQPIRYNPFHFSINENKILADIKVLRLGMERPVLLYIETPDGRRITNEPIDIVGKLLQARNPDTGDYIYNSQCDLDRIYEHPIEIRVGANLEVRIFIGEWEIVNVKPAE